VGGAGGSAANADPAVPAAAAAAASAPPVVAANGAGNEADSGPRKRPTLLLPGETAEFKGAKKKKKPE